MKSTFSEDSYETDQEKQVPQPPLTKAAISGRIISLTKEFTAIVKETNYLTLLQERKSHRIYKDGSLTLEQLSFLLWSTQGVKAIRGNNYATIRTVPSAGARHAFETYLAVFKVESLENGIYHYLPLEHAIEFVAAMEDLEKKVSDSLCEQQWAGKAAAVFFYSAVPYRSEWRYGIEAHKLMLLDAGHVVQNLYLSCQAIGGGTCAIAAFDQTKADGLLELDGENEYVIYAAPVGLV
jgi:SagB-type dehydrogenase family enzyme